MFNYFFITGCWWFLWTWEDIPFRVPQPCQRRVCQIWPKDQVSQKYVSLFISYLYGWTCHTFVNASGSHEHVTSRIRQGQSSSVTGSVIKLNDLYSSISGIPGIFKTVLALCCSSRLRLIPHFIQCVKAMNCIYAHIMFRCVWMRMFPHFTVCGSGCVHR